MKNAEAKLHAVSPDGALPPEQKALQFLQKAEEEYETQIQIQRQQGGGGGGGGGQMAQDLADLFEMELDKMANQYETRQQASQQQSDQKLDELLEKLKELARRQEQEAERQRRRAALGQQASGNGSGQSQRELADQAEEAARRLEQLSRDENRPELAQAARQLRDAADAMRRAAANGQQASGAQASQALEQLRDAQRRLQQTQSGRAERDVKNALQQAEELAREQRQIADEVKGLEGAGDRRQDRAQQLVERKGALEQKVGDLEKQLDRAASDMRANEKEAARKMAEGANSIRDNKVRDKIRYSSSMLRAGVGQSDQQAMENSIGSNLDALRNTLSQAASALGRRRRPTR
jgi:chromosome segregation ATPase